MVAVNIGQTWPGTCAAMQPHIYYVLISAWSHARLATMELKCMPHDWMGSDLICFYVFQYSQMTVVERW